MPNAITDIRYIYLIHCITKFPIHVRINGMHACPAHASVCVCEMARHEKHAMNSQYASARSPVRWCNNFSHFVSFSLSLSRSLRVQEESIRLTASCYTCTCCSWVNAALKNYQAPTRASTHIHFYILIYNSNLSREHLKFVTSCIIYLCLYMFLLYMFQCVGVCWFVTLFIFLDI